MFSFSPTEHMALNRADAEALRHRAHALATAAYTKGANARDTHALCKSAYSRIDAAPEHGEQILDVLGKTLDAVTPEISFVRPVAKAGVAQPNVDADRFWSVTVDGSVTTYRFDLGAYFDALARAGAGTVGMFPR
jgi:hypothetical protein